jgi:hypothetical protein
MLQKSGFSEQSEERMPPSDPVFAHFAEEPRFVLERPQQSISS